MWSGSAASRVDLHPAQYQYSAAYAVWEDEQVGYAGNLTGTAALWHGSAASYVNLGPTGAYGSEALAVCQGQQAGYVRMYASSNQHAALWSGSAASFVDLNPPGANGSNIRGMAPGQQVGTAGFPGTTAHAGMWSGTPGSWVDLHPANASYSWGYGTCGTAQVGAAVIPGAASAVIWFGSAQSMVSLHQFLPAGEYFQSVAMGVSFFNGQFYVSGQATRTSDHVNEAWLWVGVPSPGGATVLLTFGGMLAARRRRV